MTTRGQVSNGGAVKDELRLRVIEQHEELAADVTEALRADLECTGSLQERLAAAEKARDLAARWRRETGREPGEAQHLTGREKLRYRDWPVLA